MADEPAGQFPGGDGPKFKARLVSVADYLNREVHPHVEKGAMSRGDGFLTNHGPEHIQTVIRRASDLLAPAIAKGEITAYEVYLLVMAIHFHDVGNIFGRKKHEKQIAKVMSELRPLISDDVEMRHIRRVAEAHGGKNGDDADTISRLPFSEHAQGQETRPQFLAAVLRFSDELADESARAARFLMKLNKIPPKSEVFHAYAQNLHSVYVNNNARSVELSFELYREHVIRKYGKGRDRVFLLDEIFDRTLKMHSERMYCSRFMVRHVHIEEVRVKIEVFVSNESPRPFRAINYSLRERGYPNPPKSVRSLCPEVTLTGASLCKSIRKVAAPKKSNSVRSRKRPSSSKKK